MIRGERKGNGSMRFFQADYEWNREHELILTRAGGISRNELEDMELAMLEDVRVPGLLPIEWEDTNGTIRLRYRLTGKRMLKQRIEEGLQGPEELYQLLYGIVSTIEECRSFLLVPDNLLLDESFIFVGETWNDSGMVYVPMRAETVQDLPLRARLLALAAICAGSARRTDMELPSVLKEIGDEKVPLSRLKQRLLILSVHINGIQSVAQGNDLSESRLSDSSRSADKYRGSNSQRISDPGRVSDSSETMKPSSFDSSFSQERSVGLDGLGQAFVRQHMPEEQSLLSGLKGRRMGVRTAEELLPLPAADTYTSDETEPMVKKPPNRAVLTLATAAFAALPWKLLYGSNPTKSNQIICIGAALLACAVFVRIWRKREAAELEAGHGSIREANSELKFEPDSGPLAFKGGQRWAQAETPEHMEEERHSGSKERPDALGNVETRFQKPVYGAEADTLKQTASTRPKQQGAVLSTSGGHNNQAILQIQQTKADTRIAAASNSERTVLLGVNNEKSGRSESRRLVRNRDGVKESMELPAGTTTIGRSIEAAQWVDSTNGISRLHLEVDCGPDGCTAKDLGSRNGSLLNGRMMIPYKKYKLENGDVLQLAGTVIYSFEQHESSRAS